MWMHGRAMEYFFCVRRMSGNRRSKKVSDAVWVMPDHVGVSVLPWQEYVSGLLQQHSVGSDDASDDVKKCKSHVEQQITLKYSDLVVRDVPIYVEPFAKICAICQSLITTTHNMDILCTSLGLTCVVAIVFLVLSC
jgi:hypothetical protein